MSQIKFYSKREEKANYLSHALGAIIAAIATIILIRQAIAVDDNWAILAFSVYGFGMLACMLSSTVYHYIQKTRAKTILRRFDHANIYVLIASSYSPLTLILLRNEGLWGYGLFAFIWLFALIGIGLNFREMKANNHLKTASFVLMGMSLFVAIKPLIEICTTLDCLNVLYWVLAGGVFYIVGSLFYALSKFEFSHAIFHVFVLLGLSSHIIATSLIPI